jgi:hypothetical protein
LASQESPELQGLRQEHGFLQEALDTKEMVEFLRSLNAAKGSQLPHIFQISDKHFIAQINFW